MTLFFSGINFEISVKDFLRNDFYLNFYLKRLLFIYVPKKFKKVYFYTTETAGYKRCIVRFKNGDVTFTPLILDYIAAIFITYTLPHFIPYILYH